MGHRVDISVHVESCCEALAPRSGELPAVGVGGIAWVAAAGLAQVAARATVLAAQLTVVAVGVVLYLAATTCRVIGALEGPLRLGAAEAVALARRES